MIYNILDFGAIADGKINNQKAIQDAIDACSKTGGTVVVPTGNFLSGTIRLKSNIELHLEMGSRLIASQNQEDIIIFEEDKADKGTMHGITDGCFIYACHEKNIIISGNGVIDGQGRNVYFDDNADEGFHECPLNIQGFRPRTTYLEDVEGLTVKGITFYDACFWTLHMAGCKNVLIDGIRIQNNDRGPNNDGIDPDGCQNVVISNCIIECGDDTIVLKATKPIWEKYGDCENVTINNCILHSRDSALKIGTESYGNVRNVVFSDCLIRDCSRAIGIWVRDGGMVENIHIHHVVGNTRRYADCPKREFAPRWWGKGEPIFISSTYRTEEKKYPGKIKDIFIDHIKLESESAIFIAGEKDSVIEDISITDSKIIWKNQSEHFPNMFDEQPSLRNVYEHRIPWLYLRHVNGVNVNGIFQIDESLSQYIDEAEIIENGKRIHINLK